MWSDEILSEWSIILDRIQSGWILSEWLVNR
jgi:hypothetical protein